jgi:hypothetical protein
MMSKRSCSRQATAAASWYHGIPPSWFCFQSDSSTMGISFPGDRESPEASRVTS